MFMVVMTVCTIQGMCATFPFPFRMERDTELCLLLMTMTAKTLHIAKPNLWVKDVTCIPMEET